jgi:serine/threonine-protein kinase
VEALDCLFRGRQAAREAGRLTGGGPAGSGPARSGLDRASALLELARARAPHDPRVLAAVARARLGRATTAVLQISAERLAREAVLRAPTLPEAHLALAEVLRFTGDVVGAARSIRQALAVAPGSAEASAAAGALWREAGDAAASAACLEQALALDPALPGLRVEVLRNRVMLGRTETVLAGPALERARFGLWYPDLPPIGAREPPDDRVRLLRALRRGRWVPETAWQVLEPSDPDHRLRAEAARLEIEARCYAGFTEVALRRLERAGRAGLLDPVWLERCPLLDDLRTEPGYERVARAVASRALAVRRALTG